MRNRTERVSQIDKDCDQLWSKVILERDPKCLRCNLPSTDAHHIFKRRKRILRWNLQNGVGVCRRCHSYFEAHPKDNELITQKVGLKVYERLKILESQIERYPNMNKIYEDLKSCL